MDFREILYQGREGCLLQPVKEIEVWQRNRAKVTGTLHEEQRTV